jgi:hypothetical protein
MSNEKSRRSNEGHGFGLSIAALPNAEQWMDTFKQQFQLTLDLADAALAGAERMRGAQLEATREFQAQNRRSAEAIAGVKDMPGLLAVQSALASAQWQGAMRYLPGLAEIMQQANVDCARILESRCTRLGENWKQAAAAGAPQQTGGDLSGVWKSAFDAARVSSETMMRALTGQAPWLQKPDRDESPKARAPKAA